MTNRNRKRLIAIALALLIPLVGLPMFASLMIPAFMPKPKLDNEGFSLMLLRGYDDRNAAAVNYFDRARDDMATANELRKYADDARALGAKIKKNLLIPNPDESARADFEQYIAIQCTIARKAENALSRSVPWTKASYWRDSYNTAAHGEMTTYERIFGSKRLLMRDCGQQ